MEARVEQCMAALGGSSRTLQLGNGESIEIETEWLCRDDAQSHTRDQLEPLPLELEDDRVVAVPALPDE